VAIQHERARFFYYIYNMALAFILANALRMGYTDPRPFWAGNSNYNTTITNQMSMDCYVGFGNPDPHTVVSISFAVTILLECGCSKKLFYQLPIGILYMIFIAYARCLLGVSTFSQALFGVTMGLWIGFGQWH